ncbi:MAG: zinc ribbon domain-containing protein [Peptoniphilus sp.]|nr:zinc ribbon domain-containing protein [Peptoniphilus sp.]
MFFIMGINQGRDSLEYNGALEVHDCGKYGRKEVFVVYNSLSLFFIPLFKFGKKYYVKYNCCDKIYQLKEDVGKEVERGEDPFITEDDLTLISQGREFCSNCGYPIERNFDFCPKCGEKL